MNKLSLKNCDIYTVNEAFMDFKQHCFIKNLSEETIKLYQYQYNVFSRFLGDATIPISSITNKTIDEFVLYLRSDEHGCNEVTVCTYLRGIRAYLYYCMEMDYLQSFKINIPKVTKKIKETYTDDELALLLRKPDLKKCNFTEYKMGSFKLPTSYG